MASTEESVKLCQEIWRLIQWLTDWKRSNTKKEDLTNIISHAKEIMLRIIKCKLKLYKEKEMPDVQADFTKCQGTQNLIAEACWIIEKAKDFQKGIIMCFIDYIDFIV